MKKKFLKGVAILMAAVMLLSAFPMLGFAADAQTDDALVLAQDDDPENGMQKGFDAFWTGVVIAGILNCINAIFDSILLAPLQIFFTLRSN